MLHNWLKLQQNKFAMGLLNKTLRDICLLPWQASGGSRRGLAVELAASPTGGLKSVPSEASLKSANDMIEAAILQGNNFLKVCCSILFKLGSLVRPFLLSRCIRLLKYMDYPPATVEQKG
jgi:hypothetical protein